MGLDFHGDGSFFGLTHAGKGEHWLVERHGDGTDVLVFAFWACVGDFQGVALDFGGHACFWPGFRRERHADLGAYFAWRLGAGSEAEEPFVAFRFHGWETCKWIGDFRGLHFAFFVCENRSL